MKNTVIALFMATLLAGCAGTSEYFSPTSIPPQVGNTIEIDASRDAVWDASVPALGKEFFVINNLDKSSGLINVSYSGDPERYMDCGRIKEYVKNAAGERTYDFPAARGQQRFEVMNTQGLFIVERSMSLDGRANVIFEAITPQRTRVTVSTRYVVQRNIRTTPLGHPVTNTRTDTVSFNTGSVGRFPLTAEGRGTECVPNGEFERQILKSIKQ